MHSCVPLRGRSIQKNIYLVRREECCLKEADGCWSQAAAGKTVDQTAAAPAKPAAAAAVSAAAAEAAVPAAAEAAVPAAAAAVGQLEQKGTNSASGGCTESLKIS
jgi:hypothetical protein